MTQTTATETYNQKSSKTFDYEKIANRKIDFATAGLLPFLYKDRTQNVSPENTLSIAEYILAMKAEINLSDAYRTTIIQGLSLLSRFCKNKSFANISKQEVLFYLDSLRKPDILDPLHKWIGTYNLKRTFSKILQMVFHEYSVWVLDVLTVDAYQKNARIADHQVSVQIVVGKSVVAGITLINQQQLIFMHTTHSSYFKCPFLFLFHIRENTLLSA